MRRFDVRAATLVLLVAVGAAAGLAVSGGPPTAEADTGPPFERPAAARPAQPVVFAPRVPDEPSGGTLHRLLPWGDGPGQVGVTRTQETEARGPGAFAVADDGRIAILDSVNARIVVVPSDGEPRAPIPLDLRTPRFLAVTADLIHVLDADDDLALVSYTWDGTEAGRQAVDPFEQPVTALLLDADGTPIIETAHSETAPVGGNGPAQAQGPREPGRPTRGDSGGRMRARVAPGARPVVEERRGAREGSWELDLGRNMIVDHLTSLDIDAAGRLVVGCRVERVAAPPPSRDDAGRADGSAPPMAPPTTRPASLLVVMRVGDDAPALVLHDEGSVDLGQPYVVAPDGRVFRPEARDDGYAIWVHEFLERVGS